VGIVSSFREEEEEVEEMEGERAGGQAQTLSLGSYGLEIEWVVGIGCVRVHCARGEPEHEQDREGEGKSTSGSSTASTSTSTSDPELESGEEVRSLHGMRLLTQTASLSRCPRRPQRLALFFDAGPWIVQPMALPYPYAQLSSMEPIDREHAPDRAGSPAPGDPSCWLHSSAAYVGTTPANAQAD
jgi:hypothetical protein